MLTFSSIASSSAGNVNILSDGATSIILDCGVSWRRVRSLIGYDRAGDMPILITHEHRDHCKGILDTQCRNDVYLSRETKEALKLTGYNHHIVEHGKTYTVGTWRFVPFSVVHDVPCLGYLIVNQKNERAAYITDTAYVPNRLPPLTLLAVECNYCVDILDRFASDEAIGKKRAQRIKDTHFGLDNVLEFLRANDLSQLKEVHLLHLSNGNSDETRMIVSVEDVAPGVQVFASPVRSSDIY